jgi:Fur family peroxide stress response transcriptional regulator
MEINRDPGKILKEKGLKITPQRVLVLSALFNLLTHPTADEIIEYVKKEHSNIAVATIYKILDIFVEKGIVERVKTSRDIMRYDPVPERHHHLYVTGTNRISDFIDPVLDDLLASYFSKKKIPGFLVDDFRLQIIGRYIEEDSK